MPVVSKFSIAVILLTLSLCSLAEDLYPFENEMDRQRFQRFSYEMRCPMCQSQNLAGSDSMISQDLKRELHRLIVEGKSDEEVVDFMVSRYGEFVLYKPKAEGGNLVLWLSPLVFLLIGLSAFAWVIIKKQPPADEE